MIVSLMREWIGAGWKPDQIWFEHREPPDSAELQRILGCPIRFDCETNTVWFDTVSAAHRNPKSDERLFHLLSWFAETVTAGGSAVPPATATFRERVLASIDRCANLGNASVHSVSRALGLESRTFQRRLAAENTSFRELFEEYLQRQAVKLLQNPELSEKEIAARLGYGSLNAFIRAFRRWNGVTPGQFRWGPAGMPD
jgi:AraC-like DNA-binding protein